ncbi:nucleoside deaminase, partial [Xanthomonas oryzae pv. oryzae]
VGELTRRGIEVVRDVLRDQACAVLRNYGEGRGDHY